jgi:hypothetical protein
LPHYNSAILRRQNIYKPREDDIGQLKSVPSGVLEDEILTGTVADEDHEHNGDSTKKKKIA